MFHKNLKYYRLMNNLSKKELASLINVTPMAISNYENGNRKPNMDIVKALADVLHVKVSDFLTKRESNLVFKHGEFRKNSKLSQTKQEYIQSSLEEYIGRFYSAVEILGSNVLPKSIDVHTLFLEENDEINAYHMRKFLRISEHGPIGNLIEMLENKGIIVYLCEMDDSDFSGMNGLVNNRPYIVVNATMTPERIRSTIAHEMAHFMFNWEGIDEKIQEKKATAIAGAFLFPKEDVIRELGIRRSKISMDMTYICKEYGISMYLLVKRANICKVVSDQCAKEFYVFANKNGWKKAEPVRIEKEKTTLFEQLVFRAVSENEISVQKGAELLDKPFSYVNEHCFHFEV